MTRQRQTAHEISSKHGREGKEENLIRSIKCFRNLRMFLYPEKKDKKELWRKDKQIIRNKAGVFRN